jgi:hypothetical protein
MPMEAPDEGLKADIDNHIVRNALLVFLTYKMGNATLTMWRPLSAKFGTNFADKRRSLADSRHGVFLYL